MQRFKRQGPMSCQSNATLSDRATLTTSILISRSECSHDIKLCRASHGLSKLAFQSLSLGSQTLYLVLFSMCPDPDIDPPPFHTYRHVLVSLLHFRDGSNVSARGHLPFCRNQRAITSMSFLRWWQPTAKRNHRCITVLEHCWQF